MARMVALPLLHLFTRAIGNSLRFALAALTVDASELRGQTAPAGSPNVFLDCQSYCDDQFFRTEITYVNWVRDRSVADVHVLVTSLGTASGGSEWTLAFIGQKQFAGLVDTLRYVAPQSNTSDLTRRGLSRTLKLGFVRFLARTELAERVAVTLSAAPATSGKPAEAKRDRWNYWQFSVNSSANSNGQKSNSFSSLSGGFTARRTTEAWKLNFSVRESYNESKFRFDDVTTTSIRRSYNFSSLAVRSLTPKLSAGLTGSIGSTTFDNKKLYVRATPAIEYDFFPYSEFTRHALTLQYAIGVESNNYQELTIFDKLDEVNPIHSLNLSFAQNQRWGSANIGASAGQFLNMTNKNYASLFAGTSVRLLKGLSINFSGSFSSIHDQIALPKRGATQEEVLLQQRSLATSYSYYGYVSLNYTFGSIFNNVVNPRFGGSNGGQVIFF